MSEPETENQAQEIAPYVACDDLADTVGLVERWWRKNGEHGLLTAESADILTLCLQHVRGRAYQAALGVREYAMLKQRRETVLIAEAEELRKASKL